MLSTDESHPGCVRHCPTGSTMEFWGTQIHNSHPRNSREPRQTSRGWQRRPSATAVLVCDRSNVSRMPTSFDASTPCPCRDDLRRQQGLHPKPVAWAERNKVPLLSSPVPVTECPSDVSIVANTAVYLCDLHIITPTSSLLCKATESCSSLRFQN